MEEGTKANWRGSNVLQGRCLPKIQITRHPMCLPQALSESGCFDASM
jgi:hypothetical protein